MSRLTAGLLAAAVALAALPASAARKDPELWRLGSPRESLGDGAPSPFYSPDAQARFESLSTQIGLALTSVTGGPARTTGASGFFFGVEWNEISVPSDHELGGAAVWPTAEGTADTTLYVPTLHARKGLPYSLELGMRLSQIRDSSMLGATFELRAGLVEGVESAPDVSVRAHATKLLGARDLNVVAGGLDFTVSKDFPVKRTLKIAPYAGWNPTLVFGTSHAIDFDPSNEQFDNPSLDDAVFDSFTAIAHRFYFGARVAWGPAAVGLEFSHAAAGDNSIGGGSFTTGLAF